MQNKSTPSRAKPTLRAGERIDLNCSAPVGLFTDGDSTLYLVAIADGGKVAITLVDPLGAAFVLHALTDEPIDDGCSLGQVNLRLTSALTPGALYLEQTGIILLDQLQVSLTCERQDRTLTSVPIGTFPPNRSHAHSAFDGWSLEVPYSRDVLLTRSPSERLTPPAPSWHRPAGINEIFFDL